METVERPGVCTYDCPDTCSLSVVIGDEKIIKVKGSKANGFTDGVICDKVAHDTTAMVHGPLRLRTPLKRSGPKGTGEFTPISWEAALTEIQARTQAVIDA
ncbi:MAG: molybdopterin-dependent oxidoreductase, partial [Proteobacteria bacterium]|nr:molybdopterin-dependent oxidoreductase [Pseudomonadota bacterium]